MIDVAFRFTVGFIIGYGMMQLLHAIIASFHNQ